ncbi:MAG: sulfite exporter TauE/SafE family protein [Candidatus Melainabacteria bacterium]|nr:sulfite exporter TauE/SafE family protein [Candidatus Melainabacteria bacterium]
MRHLKVSEDASRFPTMRYYKPMNIESIAVLVVATFAGVVASISGFGIGSLLTPLFALRMDFQLAVAAVSIPHLIATAYRFILIRKDLNKAIFIKFGIWSALGGLLGSLIGVVVQHKVLALTLSILLIFTGLTGVLGLAEKMRFAQKFGWLAGLSSGIFGGLVGNQGGIRSAALLGFDLSKTEFVATTTAIGLVVDAARMPIYFSQRASDMAAIWSSISVAIAGVVIGTWLGKKILNKIPERIFKRVVCAIILLLGIGLLLR